MSDKKLRTVIVDDDPYNIIDLKDCLLPYMDRLEIIGEFHDGQEGLQGIRTLNPDLAFLDIDMPKMSGFQVMNELKSPPVTIFVTAHGQYALESFEHSPADFLTKPVDPMKLKRAVENAIRDFQAQKNEERLQEQQKQSGHLAIKYKDKFGITRTPFITPSEILFVRTSQEEGSHYIEIHLASGKVYQPIKQSLSGFHKSLDTEQFIYIYKNIVANRSHFSEFVDNRYLILQGKQEPITLEVSRRYKKAVQQTFKLK